MNEVQMWRAAAEILTEHGEAAEAEALRRADAALDGGVIETMHGQDIAAAARHRS